MNEITEKEFFEAARLFKSLSHPLRLAITCGLRSYPCTQTFMAHQLGIPQSTVAQHLKVLRSQGIVKCERKGLEVVFSLHDPVVPLILDALCQHRDHAKGFGFSWKELGELEKKRRLVGL